MKTVTLGLCLAVFAYGIALANESPHAAIVDMPEHQLRHLFVNWDAEQRLRSYRGRLKEEVHEATRLN